MEGAHETTQRRRLGETFGHVVPGTFYLVIGLVMLAWTRVMSKHQRGVGEDATLATNGSPRFLVLLGWAILTVSVTGFMIEGIGGILHNGSFFKQLSHETMYGGFIIVGAAALLEGRGRLPFDAWRYSMAMAFFTEGAVFYGHALEQGGTESALHIIMVLFSVWTGMSFFWGARSPASILPHALGIGLMMIKGAWFFVISEILYSGVWGTDGERFMMGHTYTVAGVVVIVFFVFVGLVLGYGDQRASELETKAGVAGVEMHNGNGVSHERIVPVRTAKYTAVGNGIDSSA